MTDPQKGQPAPSASLDLTEDVPTPIPGSVSSPPPAPASPSLGGTLLRTGWFAMLLGAGLAALALLTASASGAEVGWRAILAAFGGRIAWSVVVCAGIAVGTAAGASERVSFMGLAGFLAAPVGFQIARIVHAGLAQVVQEPAGASLSLVALWKAVEFGFLGACLGWLGRRHPGLARYGGAGLATGAFFGGAFLLVLARGGAPPPSLAGLWVHGFQEILFPLGCSLVLFGAERSRRGASG